MSAGTTEKLTSQLCSQALLQRPDFQDWVEAVGERRGHMHRKIWEWAYIAQALHERGMLAPGKRGLGFAVGREPLIAVFACRGSEIVATDAPPEVILEGSWKSTNQYAENIDVLNERNLCDKETFAKRVTFRHVDMNHIPADLRDFDFVWSSCSFEHLGSIALGKTFMENMMACLKPGGVAVHTTEFNLSSDTDTADHVPDVLFRQRDIIEMCYRLRAKGHQVDLDLTRPNGPIDQVVDKPPYTHDPHLRLMFGDFMTTSVGLIVTKDAASIRDRVVARARLAMNRQPEPQ